MLDATGALEAGLYLFVVVKCRTPNDLALATRMVHVGCKRCVWLRFWSDVLRGSVRSVCTTQQQCSGDLQQYTYRRLHDGLGCQYTMLLLLWSCALLQAMLCNRTTSAQACSALSFCRRSSSGMCTPRLYAQDNFGSSVQEYMVGG
jgi:hypothetical protein